MFQNGTPATTVLQGDSLIINGAGAPVPQSTSVGAIMGFIAAGIAFLILLSAIILVIMRGRARRKQSVNAQEKVTVRLSPCNILLNIPCSIRSRLM